MRLVPIVAALAVAPQAHAERSPPDVVAGAALGLTFQSMGKLRMDGGGVAVDLAHRVGPISLAIDAAALWTELEIEPARMQGATGYLERAGLSARWIAASLESADAEPLGVELRLEGGAGVQSIGYPGGRLTRPDSWLGSALQVRSYGRPKHDQLMFQVGFRIGFAPPYETMRVARTICRGECTIEPGPSPMDTSWTILIGGSWGY